MEGNGSLYHLHATWTPQGKNQIIGSDQVRCSFLTTRIIFILLFRLLPSSPWSSELPSLSPWRNKLYKHTGTECYIPDITWLLLHQIYLSISLSAFFWLHLYCVTITAVRNGNNMDKTAPFATWHSYQQRCPRSTLARVELLYPALKAIRNLALLKMLGKSKTYSLKWWFNGDFQW